MKPRNVSVSTIQVDGVIKVWNSTFTLKGQLPMEFKARQAFEKKLAKFMETIEFPDELLNLPQESIK